METEVGAVRHWADGAPTATNMLVLISWQQRRASEREALRSPDLCVAEAFPSG